jgi:hypothetical protein
MDDAVQALSSIHGGLVPAAGLLRHGIDTRAANALVAAGVLSRIRRGMFADAPLWDQLKAEGRYRLFVRSTIMLADRPLVLSHLSAAAMYGLPKVGPWPATVHIIDTRASGGSSARFITSHRGGPDPVPIAHAGLMMTSLARTLVNVAATSSFLTGVAMIDHALREERERAEIEHSRGVQGLPALSKDDLYAELAVVNPRTGARRARMAIDFASDLSASLGESLGRVRIFELGFEVPELQVHFRIKGKDYWVDYFWRRIRKIGEFDGDVKYTRGMVLGDRDPSEVIVSEKKREDILRQHVNSFDRWDWNTALSPRQFSEFLIEHGVPRA